MNGEAVISCCVIIVDPHVGIVAVQLVQEPNALVGRGGVGGGRVLHSLIVQCPTQSVSSVTLYYVTYKRIKTYRISGNIPPQLIVVCTRWPGFVCKITAMIHQPSWVFPPAKNTRCVSSWYHQCNNLFFIYFILLIHEGSQREVCLEFQPSFDIVRRSDAEGCLDHRYHAPPAYTALIANSASTQS